jgi:integrase
MLLLRRPQVQAGTLANELNAIAHVYEWAHRCGIDLDDRFTSGNGLRPDEANALFQNLRYVRKLGRSLATRRLTDAAKLKVVTGSGHAVRVAIARDYMVWGLERTLYRLDVGDSRHTSIRERCDIIKRLASAFQGGVSEARSSRIGLSAQERARLLLIVDPEYKQNPFNRPVRFRNWVIILIMLLFGFRRGELLKLYVAHVNARGHSPWLELLRLPDDPNDPRANEPAVKTHGRRVPLSDSAARILTRYIQRHRSQFPTADESPFLFLSSVAKPLSLRSVNAIFEQLGNRFPEFRDRLTPHVLRYTFNDSLDRIARAEKLDSDAIKSVQNYLNGWSLVSNQGEHYSRRAIEERAREISLEHQRGMFR